MKILTKQIDDIADVIAGQSPPSSAYNKDGEGIPFFQGKADFGITYPEVRSWCTKPIKIALPNDILISVRAPVGPVNLCKAKACIGRGLSAIRAKKGISFKYLYYFFKANERKISRLGTGSTFKAITQKQIKHIKVPIPELEDDQIRIATLLSRAEELIAKRKESIRLLNELVKSIFLEMFGDPIKNEKGWNKKELKKFGIISTGNTPPRKRVEFYNSNFLEWIKTDNICEDRTYVTKAAEYLSEKGVEAGRTLSRGALLVTCIAGSLKSIGNIALTDRKIAFNQQINAIQPNSATNSHFLYWLFKITKKYIQSYATKGMKKIIIKSIFEKILMIQPPFERQEKFGEIALQLSSIKTKFEDSLHELDNLYGSLSQRAFRGELDLGKVPVEFSSRIEISVSIPDIDLTVKVKDTPADLKEFSNRLMGIIKANFKATFSFDYLRQLFDEHYPLDTSEMEEEEIRHNELLRYEQVKVQVFKWLKAKKPLLVQELGEVMDEENKPQKAILLRAV